MRNQRLLDILDALATPGTFLYCPCLCHNTIDPAFLWFAIYGLPHYPMPFDPIYLGM